MIDKENLKDRDEEDSNSSQDDYTSDSSHVSVFISNKPGDTLYWCLIDDIEGEVVFQNINQVDALESRDKLELTLLKSHNPLFY